MEANCCSNADSPPPRIIASSHSSASRSCAVPSILCAKRTSLDMTVLLPGRALLLLLLLLLVLVQLPVP